MSDSENIEVEQNITEETITEETPVKKSGKGVMTEKKLANLEKARAARAAKLAEQKKNPKPKVKKAKMSDYDLEEMVERKAAELIEKKKVEQELAEYRLWKKEQANLAKAEAEVPEKKTKKTTVKKKVEKPKAPKKPPVSRKKKVVESDSDSEVKPKKGRKKKVVESSDEEDYPQQYQYSNDYYDPSQDIFSFGGRP